VQAGIAFGAGYLLGRWTAGGNFWGGGFHWDKGDININRPIDINRDRVTHWQHNPRHRHGVKYANANVRQRFVNSNIGVGVEARANLRSRATEGLRPERPRGGKAGSSSAKRKYAAAKSPRKSVAKRAGRSKAVSHRAKRTAHSQRAYRKARSVRAHRNFSRPTYSRRFSVRGFRGGGRRGRR
jgi:hypothetical protein